MTVPVIIVAQKDFLFEKNISNMQEIMARGGDVILITDKDGERALEDLSVKKLFYLMLMSLFNQFYIHYRFN